MERHEAWAELVRTREELFRLLDELHTEPCTWSMMVITLDQAVELLHRTCREFEDGDASEIHEDCYIPLFDALSYLTHARYMCNAKGARVPIVERIQATCELARESLASPAELVK